MIQVKIIFNNRCLFSKEWCYQLKKDNKNKSKNRSKELPK